MKHATMTDVSAKPVPLTDIPTLRKRAREHIDQGAVTTGYAADRDKVIAMLNEALATELVCVLRYRRHYFMASGILACEEEHAEDLSSLMDGMKHQN